MQDRETGIMEPLKPLNQAENIALAQRIADAAIPDRSRQGGILAVGQTVELCGCWFKIASIHKRKVILKGVPTP